MSYAPETVKNQIDAIVSTYDSASNDILIGKPVESFKENYKKLRKLTVACLDKEDKELIETLPPEISDSDRTVEVLAYLKEMLAVLESIIVPPSFL